MMKNWRFIEFNIGFLFISSSAVLGRYITASSTLATLLRCVIAALCLYGIARLSKASLSIDWHRHWKVMIGTSALTALHWTTYFYSLDYSNVSIGLMTLYTFPAMTAIIEPLWHRERIPMKNVFMALLALLAVYIIAPPFSVDTSLLWAIGLGLFSAFCYSIRNVWITSITSTYSGVTLMTYQLALMSLILLPSLIWIPFDVAGSEWGAMILLGVVTTALGHTMFLRGLSFYKATTASLLSIIIPVYGVTLGFLILGEVPTVRTLIGGMIILLIILIKALDTRKAA